jgi:hypothetical protein
MNEYETNKEHAIRAHNNETDFYNFMNQSTIEAGQIAVKSLFLINGGAVVAMLGFIANTFGEMQANAEALIMPLMHFVVGVGLTALTSAMAYFTQYCFTSASAKRKKKWDHPYVEDTKSSKLWRNWGVGFQVFAILSAVGSFVVFSRGIFQLADALRAAL